MKILYIGKFPAEEIAFSTLYEDVRHMECEVEISDEDYAALLAAEQARADWQARLCTLYEKSTRRDKR